MAKTGDFDIKIIHILALWLALALAVTLTGLRGVYLLKPRVLSFIWSGICINLVRLDFSVGSPGKDSLKRPQFSSILASCTTPGDIFFAKIKLKSVN